MTGWVAGDRVVHNSQARNAPAEFVKRTVLQRIFGSPERNDLANLRAEIAADSVRIQAERPVCLVFFDSFDWRLFRRGWALVQDGSELHLCDRETGLARIIHEPPDLTHSTI